MRSGTRWAVAAIAVMLGASSALAQSAPPPANMAPAAAAETTPPVNPPAAPAAKSGAAAAPRKPAGPPPHYLPSRFAGRAGMYYKSVWGIDSLSVKWAESGELIRFTWRVLEPDKARLLNDKKAEPSLIDPQAGVSLVVPVMEKVGQLRQSAPPEAGKSYWMVFSNAGRLVKQGDRVSVVVGTFRADNLPVD